MPLRNTSRTSVYVDKDLASSDSAPVKKNRARKSVLKSQNANTNVHSSKNVSSTDKTVKIDKPKTKRRSIVPASETHARYKNFNELKESEQRHYDLYTALSEVHKSTKAKNKETIKKLEATVNTQEETIAALKAELASKTEKLTAQLQASEERCETLEFANIEGNVLVEEQLRVATAEKLANGRQLESLGVDPISGEAFKFGELDFDNMQVVVHKKWKSRVDELVMGNAQREAQIKKRRMLLKACDTDKIIEQVTAVDTELANIVQTVSN